MRTDRDPGRDGYRYNRRSGPQSSDKPDRSASAARQPGGQDRSNQKAAANPQDRDGQRRDRGYDNRRRGPRPGSENTQPRNPQSNRAPSGNKHITREIRPEDAAVTNTSGNRDNRDNRENRDNRDNRNRAGNPNYDKRGNRGDQRQDKHPGEPKNWSRNIRTEETSEDIRKDNERIEKEIWLEIAGIHTMKLD